MPRSLSLSLPPPSPSTPKPYVWLDPPATVEDAAAMNGFSILRRLTCRSQFLPSRHCQWNSPFSLLCNTLIRWQIGIDRTVVCWRLQPLCRRPTIWPPVTFDVGSGHQPILGFGCTQVSDGRGERKWLGGRGERRWWRGKAIQSEKKKKFFFLVNFLINFGELWFLIWWTFQLLLVNFNVWELKKKKKKKEWTFLFWVVNFYV